MPVYDFGEDIKVLERVAPDTESVGPDPIPGLSQLSEVQGGRTRIAGDRPLQSAPGYQQEFLIPGFKALDAGMRRYWSGVRVPTKDSYRFMRVKVAGGDKSLMCWRDELKGGRARLPVAALDRTGHQFNPEKYSPNTTHPMAIRYPSRRGDLAIKVFRPVPFLVEYNMLIWAERKRDAEFILYQVVTRFNPLAEFRLFDGHLQGTVTLQYGGSQDSSDKEAGYDQHANVRYEVAMTAEAWLPLPEQVVKTVLGRVTVLRERVGEVLLAGLGGSGWYEPVNSPRPRPRPSPVPTGPQPDYFPDDYFPDGYFVEDYFGRQRATGPQPDYFPDDYFPDGYFVEDYFGRQRATGTPGGAVVQARHFSDSYFSGSYFG